MAANQPGGTVRADEAVSVVVRDAGEGPGLVPVPPMAKPARITTSGFFDPADPEQDAQVLLRRLVDNGREEFELLRPIGYWHNEEGGIIVPANLAQFRTDLTSVPSWFTWLIPKSGLHLPAALIHDGLVCAKDEPQTYVADHPIPRASADQIFRDGMRDLGTSVLRRWLMWTAVTLATLWCCVHKWWFRVVMTVEILLISVLGAAATMDLFSRRALLPWMGHRPIWEEAITGSLMAAVVPCVLAVLWGHWWRAGIITGLALALLFHVTIAITVVSGLFQGAERLMQRRWLSALAWFGSSLGVIALIAALALWAAS